MTTISDETVEISSPLPILPYTPEAREEALRDLREADPELARLRAQLQARRLALGQAVASLPGLLAGVQDALTDLITEEGQLSQRLAYAEGLRRGTGGASQEEVE